MGNKCEGETFNYTGIIQAKKIVKRSGTFIQNDLNNRVNRVNLDYSALDKFIKNITIKEYLNERKNKSNDENFNSLKRYEKEELTKIFKEKYNNLEKNVRGKLKFQQIDDNLIQSIINKENTISYFKKKVINKIISIKDDDKEYKIDHLTILLVGRKSVGKKTLINYMLKLDEDNDYEFNTTIPNENFESYESKRVPHLKLVKFKGIGLDKDSDPEIIGEKALKCIQNEIKNKEKKDYNNFFHCIWYCISGTRFEESEKKLLEKLNKAYNNKKIMPIIVVYTQNVDNNLSDQMEKYIKDEFGKEISFVKVLAKDVQLMNSSKKNNTFGEQELLNETLKKCTLALRGRMINLMTETISGNIKNKMKKINEKEEEKINYHIINNFVKEYKYTKTDEGLKNYIVFMLGKNLSSFYTNDENNNFKISNESLQLIKKSNIIQNVDDCIKYYKSKVNEIIEPIINEKANDFIDKQASIEKENDNLILENKRRLKGFKITNQTFLKRNFYYISQKYIINSIIRDICWKYFKTYREKLDSITEILLKFDYDEDIKYYLQECFLTKLEKFSKDNNINVEINYPTHKPINPLNASSIYDKDEIFKDVSQKSINLIDNFNDSDDDEINQQITENTTEKNWYPFIESNWRYLNKESNNSLINFLQNSMIYQDSFFTNKDNNIIFNSLKDYMINDLIKIFESEKKNFIVDKISKNYYTRHITCDKNIISKIVSSLEFKNIYKIKIKNIINQINQNKEFCKIKYLTIIVIGKTGVGKSTLINGMMKEKKARTGVGKIQTEKDSAYRSRTIKFLKLFDTRGIEFTKEYSPEEILKNTLKIIDREKKNVENPNENNFQYYDYIQCIWYCVSNKFEEKELEIIKNLKKKYKSIPIIIVFTYSKDAEKVNSVKNDLLKNFDDIPFISVLAEPIFGQLDSFGLDSLLNETIKICKRSVEGDTAKKITDNSFKTLEKSFKDKNKLIKVDINNKLVKKFINEYNKVLNDFELNNYILKLFEFIFIEYLNSNEINELDQQNKENLLKITNIVDFIKLYNQHYKKNADQIIEKILDKEAIKFLDEQVKKEKQEFKQYINKDNKCNKEDFKEIIKTFLKANFSYISQKYIIYRVIKDVSETILEYTETSINKLVKELLNEFSKDLLKNIYKKKFEDLEGIINGHRRNNKIYEVNENDTNETITTSQNQNVFESHNMSIINAPAPPINA